MGSVWYNLMSCVIFENLCVYYIASVMLLYVVCKGTKNQEQSWSKIKMCTECNYIMKHVDIWDNVYNRNWKQNAKQL